MSSAAPPRLALIDDDPQFRRLVRRVAEPLGWAVTEYENGLRFLEAGYAAAPDLVFLDVLMPERDGIEVAPALARRFPDARIVVVTGGDAVLAEAARQIGAQDSRAPITVLRKPAGLDELRAALDGGAQ
jgi:two-component system KDP operon response regulator KdpE